MVHLQSNLPSDTAIPKIMSNGHSGQIAGSANDDAFLPDHQLSLPDLCAHINGKVTAFLGLEPKDAQMKRVQEQTRTSLHVIDEALKRYE
jgi:hypothetical protein